MVVPLMWSLTRKSHNGELDLILDLAPNMPFSKHIHAIYIYIYIYISSRAILRQIQYLVQAKSQRQRGRFFIISLLLSQMIKNNSMECQDLSPRLKSEKG